MNARVRERRRSYVASVGAGVRYIRAPLESPWEISQLLFADDTTLHADFSETVQNVVT